MYKPIIVFDMSYFLSLESMTDMDDICSRLEKSNPTLIYSGVQALSKATSTSQIISIDSYLDLEDYPYSENLGKENWLSPIDQGIIWCYPQDITPDAAFEKYSNTSFTPRVKPYRCGFPSISFLQASEVFVEFNSFTYAKLPHPIRARLQNKFLVPPQYMQNKILPIDYAEGVRIIDKNPKLGLNFFDRF